MDGWVCGRFAVVDPVVDPFFICTDKSKFNHPVISTYPGHCYRPLFLSYCCRPFIFYYLLRLLKELLSTFPGYSEYCCCPITFLNSLHVLIFFIDYFRISGLQPLNSSTFQMHMNPIPSLACKSWGPEINHLQPTLFQLYNLTCNP